MRLPFGAGILNALPLSVGLALSLAVAATDVGAQSGERPLEIGLRGGVEVHRGGLGHEHLGLSAWIPVRDAFHVVPALDLLGDFPADPLGAWTGKAWYGYLTLRTRPFGRGWLPVVGYGLAARYARADNPGRSLSQSSLELTDTIVFSASGPRWPVRPFADVYLVNILNRSGRADTSSWGFG